MTTSNVNLQRADVALSDLSSNGGILSPEQTKQFIDMIVDEPTIINQIRTVRMPTPTMKINKIGLTGRLLHGATQAGSAEDDGSNPRYLAKSKRSAPTTSQIEMSTKEAIAEVRIPYEVLEDNIEGDNFEEHVLRLIAQRAALDLEEMLLHGDTTSSDDLLALHNGFLKRATAHIVNNASAGPNDTMITNALLALPQQYLRYTHLMKAWISQHNRIRFQASRMNRQTGLGDASVIQNMPIVSQGLTVEAAPSIAADGVGSQGLITQPKNLIFGIQRQITIESDKDIRSREYIIVVTCRVALNIEDTNAMIKLINI